MASQTEVNDSTAIATCDPPKARKFRGPCWMSHAAFRRSVPDVSALCGSLSGETTSFVITGNHIPPGGNPETMRAYPRSGNTGNSLYWKRCTNQRYGTNHTRSNG